MLQVRKRRSMVAYADCTANVSLGGPDIGTRAGNPGFLSPVCTGGGEEAISRPSRQLWEHNGCRVWTQERDAASRWPMWWFSVQSDTDCSIWMVIW